MPSRDELLDELARCYARAAIDALFDEWARDVDSRPAEQAGVLEPTPEMRKATPPVISGVALQEQLRADDNTRRTPD